MNDGYASAAKHLAEVTMTRLYLLRKFRSHFPQNFYF